MSPELAASEQLQRQAANCADPQCRADAQLVARCLQGHRDAWNLVFKECQPTVRQVIRVHLGTAGTDDNLVEEIAGRVWLEAVKDGGRVLAGFRPERSCRLKTFLGALARNHVRAYLRQERRRVRRELHVCQADVQPELNFSQVEMDEFLETLSDRERDFLQWCTSPNQADGRQDGERFAENENSEYQLRYRLRQKVRSFFRPR